MFQPMTPPAPCSLSASYGRCREITRQRARNFYYAIRMLPAPRRDAMCAVYAFFRECDDLSDEGPAEGRRERLERWRGLLDPGLAPPYPMILPAFQDANRRFGIPARHYSDLLDGALMDLEDRTYHTFEELYGYCYRVASTVGLVCVRIFGSDGSEETERMAEHRGIAFQLTNILRDIAEDAALGRVYLPEEDLVRHGLSRDQLLTGTPGQGFEAFLREQVERARGYYRASSPLLDRIDPVSRPALAAMSGIYRTLLERIDRAGRDVLSRRLRLHPLQKIRIALQAWAAPRSLERP